MSINSQKVKSLPADLKEIADELIANKFPEEVKRAKSRDTFRQEYTPFGVGLGGVDGFDGRAIDPRDVFFDPSRPSRREGYRDGVFVEVRPWDRSRVAKVRIREPSFASLMDGLRKLDRENVVRNRRFVMNPDFYNHAMNDSGMRDFVHFRESRHGGGTSTFAAEIFGCKIIESPELMDCMLEGEF